MIRGKMLRGNCTAIIEDGKVSLFDIGGRFKEENTEINKYMTGASCFNFISVLSSNNNVEVAVIQDDIMHKFRSSDSNIVNNIGMRIYSDFRPIKILNKSGAINGVSYVQMIFMFDTRIDILSRIKSLGMEEI